MKRFLGESNSLLFASRMLPKCRIGPLHTSGGCLQIETQGLWRSLWHHSLRYNGSGHCHFNFFVTSKSWCPPSPIQNFLFHVHLQPQHLLQIELQIIILLFTSTYLLLLTIRLLGYFLHIIDSSNIKLMWWRCLFYWLISSSCYGHFP